MLDIVIFSNTILLQYFIYDFAYVISTIMKYNLLVGVSTNRNDILNESVIEIIHNMHARVNVSNNNTLYHIAQLSVFCVQLYCESSKNSRLEQLLLIQRCKHFYYYSLLYCYYQNITAVYLLNTSVSVVVIALTRKTALKP